MVILLLAILGICVGSLANAVAWRFKRGQNWLSGRSECPKCHHQLAAVDLIPLISWLGQKGRCRYCAKLISKQYPLAELAGGIVFTGSYLYWPGGMGTASAKFLLASWLIVAIGLLVLAIYDLNYHLLPSKILYPTAILAILARLIFIVKYSPSPTADVWHWLLAIAIASGVFYLIYIISHGEWIGYGDVRLGLITGTVLAQPQLAFLMIFFASVLGLAFTLPGLALGKKQLSTKLPYGPFLIVATWLVLLWGQQLINWYNHHLL